ncbi:hypothetical protein RHSIM_Rhsim11G0134000 [Rhododendron simsii]|uniref:Uncharacterized protein n=1 Tax=Rhododendron simsii TaxID=118357 RepID=A0A834GBD3_RHOSS|nr:hypothetical protein RHSIM_Rhsim11G0134000 [Rhododendron simsii]
MGSNRPWFPGWFTWPFDACTCGHCWVLGVGREATLGNVLRQKNSKINNISRSNILVAIPNDVSMAYTSDDALDDDVSEMNKAKEENDEEEEQEDGNYDDKGKGDNLKATAEV